MRQFTHVKTLVFGLAFSLSTLAGQAQQKNNAERNLKELGAWVDERLHRADEGTKEERAKLREQFNQLSSRVDAGTEKLTDHSRREFNDIRSRYQQWDKRQEEAATMGLEPERIKQVESELMGSFQPISKIKPDLIREAYITFMTNVREKRRDWTLEDWSYAEHVLGRLNDHKEHRAQASLSASDRMKIAALQGEFQTLRAGKDAKELYKEIR